MDKPSQEDLLGYVLGAMDAPEARNIQDVIDQYPELDDELLEIKNSLLPLDHLDSGGPRPGLARRTCELVALVQRDPAGGMREAAEMVYAPAVDAAGSPTTPLATSPVAPALDATPAEIHTASANANAAVLSRPSLSPARLERSPSRFLGSFDSLPNVLVTAASLAIIAGILFPVVAYTRHHSRLLACRNNLQQLGQAFLRYSDLNHGNFVAIPTAGKLAANGGFGPILKDAGLLEDDSLLACAGVEAEAPVHIPTIEQLQAANGPTLTSLQKRAGGHFGYSMGYRENGTYQPPRNAGRANVVLLADAPSIELIGRRSSNHGRHGQNALFEDGHVQFIAGHAIAGDAIYENDYGIVAPGSHARDSVIAPNHLSPAAAPIEFISMP